MAHQIYFLNLHEIWCFKLQRIKVSHIFADNFSLYPKTIHKCTTNQNNFTVIKCIYFINIQQSVDKKYFIESVIFTIYQQILEIANFKTHCIYTQYHTLPLSV